MQPNANLLILNLLTKIILQKQRRENLHHDLLYRNIQNTRTRAHTHTKYRILLLTNLKIIDLKMFDKLALILNKMRAKGDFLGGPVVKNPASKAGDVASIPGWLGN